MQKIIKSEKLLSQTTQAVIQKYFASLKSYFGNRRTNPNVRPPPRRRKFFCIPFKSSAIHIGDGNIILPCGEGNSPVIVPIPSGKVLPQPKLAEIVRKVKASFQARLGKKKKNSEGQKTLQRVGFPCIT